MKKLFVSCAFAVVVSMAGCSKYDDTDLQNRVGNLEQRVTTLEELCRQMNTNITSLQELVTALQSNDWITSVTPARQNGEEVGYTITFANGEPITIYHGKAGEKGQAGEKGKDGYTPEIGVRQDTDGIYYWTLDGSWLTDGSGKKIKAEGRDGSNGAQGEPGKKGEDGITPQLKIENDYWYVSYDKGTTWQRLGKATGENGSSGSNSEDGNSFFRSIDTESSEEYVVFTLADGTEIKLPRYSQLAISFDTERLVAIRPNSTLEIGYTITGNTADLTIEILSSDDVKAKCIKITETTGTIAITTGAAFDEYTRVLVFVSNGEKTIMSSLSFEEACLQITNGSVYEMGAGGGLVEVEVHTNAEYRVYIPAEHQSWVSDVSTRAYRDETVTLQIAANESSETRSAIIDWVDEKGIPYESVLIKQAGDENGQGSDEGDKDLNIPDDMMLAFPDPNFRQYVLGNFDKDKDGKISQEEALKVTIISCYSRGIESLEGVQYFTNLTSLDCSSNQLTDLDVSQNTALTKLYCNYNQLTDLDVSQNTALTYLGCNYNKLTDLDVSQNTALTRLASDFNELTRLDVSQNTALTYLNCSHNQLTDLDVSQNTALTYLSCFSNQLTRLDVSQNTALKTLVCSFNQLTRLDVSQNTALTDLNCSYNQLTDLDVSQNTALTDLNCGCNQLTDLDVSQNTALTKLYCDENQLTSLNVSQNTAALTELNCNYNQLTRLDVSQNTALTDLSCNSNKLTDLNVSQNTALTKLYCNYNQLTRLDVSQNTALIYLDCNYNKLTDLDVLQNTALTGLDCSRNQLTDLDVSQNTALIYLDCNYNKLTDLDVLQNTALTFLSCSVNPLNTIYLKQGQTIVDLYMPDSAEIEYVN